MRTSEISNTQDVIDSRDVIERYNELKATFNDLYDDEKEELEMLTKLMEEGDEFADWEFGMILVRDDYFEDYAQSYCEEIGLIASDREANGNNFLNMFVDWEGVATYLQNNWREIMIGDEKYWTEGY